LILFEASDDLFYPVLVELTCRCVDLAQQFIFFVKKRDEFHEKSLLNIYYLFNLTLQLLILTVDICIMFISTRGTISNEKPRRHMSKLLYIRLFFIISEIISMFIGVFLLTRISIDFSWGSVYLTVVVNVIVNFLVIIIILILALCLFDPVSNLSDEEPAETKINNVLQYLKRLFCCCYCCFSRMKMKNKIDMNYKNSFKEITALLEIFIRHGDMVPSDIAAGLILIGNKEVNQFERESIKHKKMSKNRIENDDKEMEKRAQWMNINEATHYFKYAVSSYYLYKFTCILPYYIARITPNVTPYYIYKQHLPKYKNFYCNQNCCCSEEENVDEIVNVPPPLEPNQTIIIDGGNSKNRKNNLEIFKSITNLKDEDIIYVNFHNKLFLVPFCVVVDHEKKCVVIAIRGTLSLSDALIDLTANIGYFDVDHLKHQPCHLGILNTAEFILNKIRDEKLLEKAFQLNPVSLN
jgi:sn1-specific diacylglycerol lipase